MTVHHFSPVGLTAATPYHHLAVGTGARHIHIAGQVASRVEDGGMPDDLAGQVAQSLRNVAVGLASVDASFADVLRLSFYVVDWEASDMDAFMAGVTEVAAEIGLPLPMPPASLIGVESLFAPGVLVEVEVTALAA